MLIDIALIMCFGILAILGGWLIDGVSELRQIKRAKLVSSIRNHPSGRSL